MCCFCIIFCAFQEIIFDLLGCNRAHSVLKSSLYPERMNIGIRALMVIANGLQQKEGPPDMPRSMGAHFIVLSLRDENTLSLVVLGVEGAGLI